jgi:hypothetical protein
MGSIIFKGVATQESDVRALQQGVRQQLIDIGGFLGKGKKAGN